MNNNQHGGQTVISGNSADNSQRDVSQQADTSDIQSEAICQAVMAEAFARIFLGSEL